MSTVIHKKVNTKHHKNYKVTIEQYNSAMEVANLCDKRPMTSSSFDDMRNTRIREWHGVKSYDEAIQFLHDGYQPIVENLKSGTKLKAMGTQKRIQFQNEIQGFAPIVPLAMMGVPNSMINTHIKPIKRKVLNVYYDMTASCGTKAKEIIEAGNKLAGAILELEQQGYKFNLYAVQSYSDVQDADMLVVKIKSSDKPIDLRRMSFPLCHVGFFRVIGFDWYSKFPEARYRSAYGRSMSSTFDSEYNEAIKQLFGDSAIAISAQKMIYSDKNHIKEVLLCNA